MELAKMTPPVAAPSMTSSAPTVSTSDWSSMRRTLLVLPIVAAVSAIACCAARNPRLCAVQWRCRCGPIAIACSTSAWRRLASATASR